MLCCSYSYFAFEIYSALKPSGAELPRRCCSAAHVLLALIICRHGSLCFTPELDPEPEEAVLAVGAGAAAAWLRQRGGALATVLGQAQGMGSGAAGGSASGGSHGGGAHAESEAATVTRPPADRTHTHPTVTRPPADRTQFV